MVCIWIIYGFYTVHLKMVDIPKYDLVGGFNPSENYESQLG